MKRKIFIGSSSEGIKIANQVKKEINSELGDWIECETWDNGGVFSLNKGTLESLVKASRKYDYGIMLASKDDVLVKRMRIFNVMRENVLFEMGLFLGSLGLQRAFLITHDKTSLPSDFNGVTVVKYNDQNIKDKINSLETELEVNKLLDKEKQIIITASEIGNDYDNPIVIDGEQYFNETFNNQ